MTCTTSQKIYVGAVDKEILLDVISDISTATLVELHVKKPSGATEEWAAMVYNDHFVRHVVVAGELDEAGVYKVQPWIEMPALKDHAQTFEMKVYDEFE